MSKSSMKRMISGGILAAVSVSAVVLGQRAPALTGDAPAYRQTGSLRARVTLLEYSDLQCPKCGQAMAVVKSLLAAYPDDLRVVFHHAPLKQHKWAVLAAQAAESAGFQGKFWEYAELLFAKQTEWSPSTDPKALFQGYAQTLGLDMPQFSKDMDSTAVADIVRKEKAQADAIEVPATPTFFIGDRMIVGETQLAANGARYIEEERRR